MRSESKYRITCEFTIDDSNYLAWLCPYYDLSDFEIDHYHVQHYTYVVHLFSLEGFKTFEMFVDESFRWSTDAAPLFIDRRVIDVLSYVLVKVAS